MGRAALICEHLRAHKVEVQKWEKIRNRYGPIMELKSDFSYK